jgi:hypothetical protein
MHLCAQRFIRYCVRVKACNDAKRVVSQAVLVQEVLDWEWSVERVEGGGWRMEGGGWRMEDGGWRMEDGEWRMEDGGWRMDDEGWRVGGRRMEGGGTEGI